MVVVATVVMDTGAPALRFEPANTSAGNDIALAGLLTLFTAAVGSRTRASNLVLSDTIVIGGDAGLLEASMSEESCDRIACVCFAKACACDADGGLTADADATLLRTCSTDVPVAGERVVFRVANEFIDDTKIEEARAWVELVTCV